MEQTSAKREKRKSLLRIAIPIILSSCLQISYDITDMFWVGKLGSGEVAAVGTAGFYIKLGWSLISVITIGTMVSVSHSIGAEKKDRIQHFISCGIRSTFVLGIFYALFVFMLAEPLITFQYRKTGSKHDGSELSEDKQYHSSYHVYEPFVYRHYRRTRKDTILVQGGTLREYRQYHS